MSASEEVELLRERSLTFLRHAEAALRNGEFDFSSFASEQAAQLYLKATLLELMGEVPKVHRVRELISLLSESVPRIREKLSSFATKNRTILRMLDDAYIASRYLTLRYTKEEAESLLDLSKGIIGLLEET